MFSRCLFTMVLSAGLIGGIHYFRSAPEAKPLSLFERANIEQQSAGVPEAEREKWRELDDQSRRRADFARFEGTLLDELVNNESCLREAVERVFYYSLQHYPEHLENVSHGETAADMRAKLAHHILHSLRMAEGPLQDASIATADRLEHELQSLDYAAH